MINGFSHTTTSASTLNDGSAAAVQSGFNSGLLGNKQPSEHSAVSFSGLLNSDTETLLSSTSNSIESLAVDGETAALEQQEAALTVDNSQHLLASTANVSHQLNKDPVTAGTSTVSTLSDSIVTAVSNVMSTSATLATAQVATSQLAANSVLDGKLIEATAVKETATSVDALVNSNTQAQRGEAGSNLQFKAVLDKSLSAQELGERLSSTIADKVSVQVNAKTPTATIRLDPPDLGKIDLVIKLDNDKLNIQINASSGATRESIQMTSDRLRAELVEQNFLHVDVSISGEHQQSSDHHEMVADGDFMVAGNTVAMDSDVEELVDNSELARA